jgi:hypothetical protein
VSLPDGTNLNVWLARRGYANDRYLERFRSENEALGAELDRAFAAARADRVGLWGACAASAPQPIAAPPPPAGDCHPDYSTCIPSEATAPDAAGRTTSTAAPSVRRSTCVVPVSIRTASTVKATASAASDDCYWYDTNTGVGSTAIVAAGLMVGLSSS